jgi:hypothetical protein
MTTARMIIVALVALIMTAQAEPLPQPKVGQCPAGYRESGGYCAPTNDRAPVAIPKTGRCPSNWMQSGNYCIDTRRR